MNLPGSCAKPMDLDRLYHRRINTLPQPHKGHTAYGHTRTLAARLPLCQRTESPLRKALHTVIELSSIRTN